MDTIDDLFKNAEPRATAKAKQRINKSREEAYELLLEKIDDKVKKQGGNMGIFSVEEVKSGGRRKYEADIRIYAMKTFANY